MNPQVNETVVDRIKKLLAIANDSAASQGEIENAMRAVNKLILKYNLELNSLNLQDRELHGGGLGKSIKISYGEIVEESNWEILLISTICSHNLCEEILFTTKGVRGGNFVVVGSPLNVECVLYMFETTRRMYRNLSKSRYNDMRAEVLAEYRRLGKTENDALKAKDLPYRMPWIRNYLKGCIAGLDIKLEDIRAQLDAETQEMIVSNSAAIQLYMENEFDPNDMSSLQHRQRTTDDDAYQLGMQDALDNDIHQGLNGKTHDPYAHINQTLRLTQ